MGTVESPKAGLLHCSHDACQLLVADRLPVSRPREYDRLVHNEPAWTFHPTLPRKCTELAESRRLGCS